MEFTKYILNHIDISSRIIYNNYCKQVIICLDTFFLNDFILKLGTIPIYVDQNTGENKLETGSIEKQTRVVFNNMKRKLLIKFNSKFDLFNLKLKF